MIAPSPALKPRLDPDFIPAISWNSAYRKRVEASPGKTAIKIAIDRPGGTTWTYTTEISPGIQEDTWIYCERLVKFLLWAWGGSRVRIAGAPQIVEQLRTVYSSGGKRSFDYDFIGQACFGESFRVENAGPQELVDSLPSGRASNSPLRGNRIGFDLGGSDRKCAALIDGEVVFPRRSNGVLISKVIPDIIAPVSPTASNGLPLISPK